MNVTCEKCHRVYDDAERWTICPHSPLGCAVDDLCPHCDTLKSVYGPCRHQDGSMDKVVDELDKATRIKEWPTNVPNSSLGDAVCHSVRSAAEILVNQTEQTFPESMSHASNPRELGNPHWTRPIDPSIFECVQFDTINLPLPILHRDFTFTLEELTEAEKAKDEYWRRWQEQYKTPDVQQLEHSIEHSWSNHINHASKTRKWGEWGGLPPNAGECTQHWFWGHFSPVEYMVRALIEAKATHKKKGVRIDEEAWKQIMKHLYEEVGECSWALRGVGDEVKKTSRMHDLPLEVTETNKDHVLEELADIYGVLVHAVVKAGFNMQQVEERELKKLEERYE